MKLPSGSALGLQEQCKDLSEAPFTNGIFENRAKQKPKSDPNLDLVGAPASHGWERCNAFFGDGMKYA